jgi:hypothetical protein
MLSKYPKRICYNFTAWLTRLQASSVRSLHQCVRLCSDAAAQARDAQWLPLLLELLSATPAGM